MLPANANTAQSQPCRLPVDDEDAPGGGEAEGGVIKGDAETAADEEERAMLDAMGIAQKERSKNEDGESAKPGCAKQRLPFGRAQR